MNREEEVQMYCYLEFCELTADNTTICKECEHCSGGEYTICNDCHENWGCE